MIIGLGHKARAGKDTIGLYLEDHRHFNRTAFAASLKEAVKIIYGWTDDHVYGHLKEVVDPFWNATPRDVLQKFGTEACRNNLRNDIWVKSVEKRLLDVGMDKDWVITDVRFPNEADAIKAWGGIVLKVHRPAELREAIATKEHISETALDDYPRWDGIIRNDSDLNTLFARTDEIIERTKNARELANYILG